MKQLKIIGLVLLSALVFFMTACGEDAVQLGSEPTFMTQQTKPSTAPAVSTPAATGSSEPTQPTEPVHIHAWCEATCTSAKTCTTCGETDGDALGHNWHTATCTAPKTCAACGATEGEMLSHSWDAGTVAKEATESAEGEMLYTCTACGETMTQSIPTLDHEHSYTSVVTKPTCTKNGYTTHTCCCGDGYTTDTTAALGHTFGDWQTVTEASCTEEGQEKRNCSRCDAFETRTVEAMGHNHAKSVTAPTCTEQGYTTYTCTRCQNQYDADFVSALGHDYMGETCTNPKTCKTCGATEGAAKGHDWADTTCTEPKTCKTCSTTEGAAKGHDWEEATCIDPKTCKTCGAIEGAALGHDWVEATCTNAKTCATCGVTEGSATGHNHEKVVIAPTCTADGYTTYTCSVCGDSYVGDQTEATGHVEVIDVGYPATCSSLGVTDGCHCSVCNLILVAQETIPVAEHKIEITQGRKPTETSPGLTNGEFCAVCGATVCEQIEIPTYIADYSSSFYYDQMGMRTNGSALQELYDRLDMASMAFHIDVTADAEIRNENGKVYYIAFEVAFDDLGISNEEATEIWLAYKNDHPLYYWIDNHVRYTDAELQILTTVDYCYGANRKTVNSQVFDGIQDYLVLAERETSNYYIAWAFHDAVIKAIDYARDPETNSPEDDLWAHSILGVIDGRGVVCEGYSRMFQLLLNAADVENIYVEGSAGTEQYGYEAHAWNMVKLEDGAWYWCDLTWDDRPTRYLGILYNHFCVNDSQDINWLDGGWGTEIIYFPDNHLAGVSADDSLICHVELPEISDHVFASNDRLAVRAVFTVGDFTYSINGFYTVQMVSTLEDAPQVLRIPETVEYEGVTYTVTAIGGLQQDGLYSSDYQAIRYQTKEIYLPKSIRFIWDFAMYDCELEKIHVDPENPWFTDVNGVLYTKSLYTLIQYPANAPYVEKYEIPDETHWIAYGALHYAGGRFSELVIGKNVEVFGMANWGSGYPDNNEFYGGNCVMGALSFLMANCVDASSSLQISVSPENSNFVVVNDVLYNCDNGVITGLVGSANSEITEAVIVDGVKCVSYGAFMGCKKLVRVVLPDSVTMIESSAFYGCASLTSIVIPGNVYSIGDYAFNRCYALNTITFAGTKEQWKGIEKGTYWNNYVPATEVVCVDGTVKLED